VDILVVSLIKKNKDPDAGGQLITDPPDPDPGGQLITDPPDPDRQHWYPRDAHCKELYKSTGGSFIDFRGMESMRFVDKIRGKKEAYGNMQNIRI
jgi:hypothetical protein